MNAESRQHVQALPLYRLLTDALRRAREDLRMWHMDTRYITEVLGEDPEPERIVESVLGQSSARNDNPTADAGRVFTRV